MQIYTLHIFFFVNKNMYIFIWGESSIKMSEPGERCHTHSHTHIHACMHKRAPASCLLEKPTPASPPKPRAGLGSPSPRVRPLRADPRDGTEAVTSPALLLLEMWVLLIGTSIKEEGRGGNDSTHQMGFSKPP